MSFESVNELDKFSFEDCEITDVQVKGNTIIFTIEALIVGSRNSQNTNYTDSYADTTTMELRGASITSMVVEGYRHYGADDTLIEEVPDTPIPQKEYSQTLSSMVNGFMFSAECIEKAEGRFKYSFEVDMDTVNDYGLQDPYCTTYQMDIEFAEARVSWERYLNRVQK